MLWYRKELLHQDVCLSTHNILFFVFGQGHKIFVLIIYVYSKTCVKQQLKNRQNKDLNDKWLLYESIAECSPWSILQYF